MTRLAWTFLRSAGRARAALLAGRNAVASALLLVALWRLRLPSPPAEALLNPDSEPGLPDGPCSPAAARVAPRRWLGRADGVTGDWLLGITGLGMAYPSD